MFGRGRDAHDEGSLGDPDVFERFYRANVDDLLRYFYRRTADADVAADLVSESFAAALADCAKFDQRRGSSRQWLYGIAGNQLRMFWRSQRVAGDARSRLDIPTEAIDQQTADQLRRTEDVIDGAVAIEALAQLPDHLREAVNLRVLQQLDYDEIAIRLNCSRGAARVRVFRGLEKLMEGLG